jgi:hypothetical protein
MVEDCEVSHTKHEEGLSAGEQGEVLKMNCEDPVTAIIYSKYK